METKESSQSCFKSFGPRHKKVCFVGILAVALTAILLGLASAGWKLHQYRNGFGMMSGGDYSRCGNMMESGSRYCSGPVAPNPTDQFILPQDASKSGEIAIMVNNLELAKKAVTDASAKNGGSVYATFISYASKNLKNGLMVVQVPVGNFDNAFADLKKVGTRIIQESSKQIPTNNFYYPMPAVAVDAEAPVSNQENAEETTETQEAVAKPEMAIYPAPTQIAQDKGYIKVIFADYGIVGKKNKGAEGSNFAGSFFSGGDSAGQNMKDNLIVVIGVKLIFLIAVLGLMFLVFKRIFQAIRGRKNKITKVHVTRQMSKTHKRVVKIATKKRKI